MSTHEQALIELMVRNLESRVAEHRTRIRGELADLHVLVAQMEAGFAATATAPMGAAGRIRAAGLDVERAAIALKADLDALECARRALSALEGAAPAAEG
jgi:hypothetical protein